MEQIQIMVDCIVNMFNLAFPFALCLWLVERITNYFLSLISGREVNL